MEREVIVIMGLVLFGALVGTLTANASDKRSKVHGNNIARFLHYVSCGVMATTTPFVLSSVFLLHLGFAQAVLGAVGLFVVSLALLIPYAIIEKPFLDALKHEKDKGWTAQDAKTSGL